MVGINRMFVSLFQGAVRPGVGPAQIAVIYRNLMQRLGFNKFYIQGGNWGSGIAAAMDTFYPEAVLGHHDNGVFIQVRDLITNDDGSKIDKIELVICN